MDIVQLYHQVRSRWWIIAAAVIVCEALAVIYLWTTPKIYASGAVLQVQQPGEKLPGAPDSTDIGISPEVLKTVEQNLSSQSVLLRVVHSLRLEDDPQFAPPKRGGAPYLDSEMIGLLQRKLSVELRRGTRLIDVTVEDTNAERAQVIAKTLVAQYFAQSFLDQLESMKSANAYLSDEVERFWADLLRIRTALANKDPRGLLEIASIAQDVDVIGLETRIDAEQADFASVKEVFMENHPRYIAAQRRLQELQEAQNSALLRAAQRIQNSYDSAKATQTELADKLQAQEEEALRTDQAAISNEDLARQMESDRALYNAVLAQMKQTPQNQEVEQKDVDENVVRIIEEPLVPAKPVRPRSSMVLAAAMLTGIVAAVGFIIGQDFFSSAFTSVDDVETSLGVPVLTTLPKSPLMAGGKEIAFLRPDSFEAEAFRTLRASIHLQGSQGAGGPGATAKDIVRNAVLLTSANPGEGKTTCAYNYAVALSSQGLRTLLIDGDLRRSQLTDLMHGGKGPGLSDVLVGKCSLADACRTTRHENLYLMSAGSVTGGTAELADSHKVGALLQEAGPRFDRIVIDSPPINAVSDALLIAPHVLINCLVIHSGVSPKLAVERACKLLKQVNRGVIGAILNQVGTDPRSAHQCYGYPKDFAYTYPLKR